MLTDPSPAVHPILSYMLKYNFDCKLRFLLDTYTLKEIATEITGWIGREDVSYFDALTFARDMYIGSDLTREEKDEYYLELTTLGFFSFLSCCLYSERYGVASYTIYTFGKMWAREYIPVMEAAYEQLYRHTNPMLSWECMFELGWLGSKKVATYQRALARKGSVAAKITLFSYLEKHFSRSRKAYKALLADQEFIAFVLPRRSPLEIASLSFDELEDSLMGPLWNFEIYIGEVYDIESPRLTISEFEDKARLYFEQYKERTD